MKKLLTSTVLSATLLLGALPSFAGEGMNKEDCKKVMTKEECKLPVNKDKCDHMMMNKEVASSSNGLETTIFGLPLNEGPVDRTLRFLVGAGLAGAGVYGLTTKSLSPELSWGLVGFSAIPFATSASGYCPIYQVFGLKYTF